MRKRKQPAALVVRGPSPRFELQNGEITRQQIKAIERRALVAMRRADRRRARRVVAWRGGTERQLRIVVSWSGWRCDGAVITVEERQRDAMGRAAWRRLSTDSPTDSFSDEGETLDPLMELATALLDLAGKFPTWGKNKGVIDSRAGHDFCHSR